jgi:hypothetical protein
VTASGAYSIVGIYPGTWCVSAEGNLPEPPFFAQVCHGDPSCENPTLVTLGVGEVANGVDLDFNAVPAQVTSWGLLKIRYP